MSLTQYEHEPTNGQFPDSELNPDLSHESVPQLATRLHEANRIIRTQQGQLEDAQIEVEALRETITVRLNNMPTSKEAIAGQWVEETFRALALEKKLAKAQEDATRSKTNASSSQAKANQAESERDQLDQIVGTLRLQAFHSNVDIETLTTANGNLNSTVQQQAEQISGLQSENSTLEDQLQVERERNQQLEEDKARAEEGQSVALGQVEGLTGQLEAERADRDRIVREIPEVVQRMLDEHPAHIALQNEVEELKAELVRLQEVDSDNQVLQSEIGRYRGIETRLEVMQTELQSAHSKLQAAEAEKQEAERQLIAEKTNHQDQIKTKDAKEKELEIKLDQVEHQARIYRNRLQQKIGRNPDEGWREYIGRLLWQLRYGKS